MTPQEVKVWVHLRALRERGYHFRRQRPIGRYIVDFVCLKHNLVVELDGGQHAEDAHERGDLVRDARLRDDGFRVLRFWNNEVDDDLDAVLSLILASLEGTPPTALRAVPPPRAGEG
jgi:very-short-patch-repair endonuclease